MNKTRDKKPEKIKLTKEEIIKRMKTFPERREKFIADIKKNKD